MLRTLILIGFLTISLNVYSQENTTESESKKAPISIYTDVTLVTSNGFAQYLPSNILTKKNYKFLIVNQFNIERNMFTIDFRNFGRQATFYDYETYRKAELNKYFDYVPDIVVINRFNTINTSISKN